MFFIKENRELDKFATLLDQSLTELFMERGELQFTAGIKKEKKKIIDCDKRMRADGMEKFNHEPTYVSAITFYANQKDMAGNFPIGVLVVYVEQEYLPKMMHLLKYPPVDDESEDAMLDSCGTLCNIIAGRYKSEISKAGYVELEMSHFVTYRNNAFNGVAFPTSEYHLYEMTCLIDNKKRMVLEMTMGTVPRHR
jgi:hypothetical protein